MFFWKTNTFNQFFENKDYMLHIDNIRWKYEGKIFITGKFANKILEDDLDGDEDLLSSYTINESPVCWITLETLEWSPVPSVFSDATSKTSLFFVITY